MVAQPILLKWQFVTHRRKLESLRYIYQTHVDLISCICQRNITILFHFEVKILSLLEIALRMKDIILKQTN